MLIIESISRHIKLTKEDERQILASFRIRSFRKGDSVLRIGDRCLYDYFVNSGCLRSFYHHQEKEHTITFSTAGWWTGNLKSFYNETPSLFAIEAMQDSEVMCIGCKELDELYETVPLLNKFFRIIVQRNLISTQDRVINHLSSSAADRYYAFSKKFSGLEQLIDQKIIASYLGITPSYLSRLRKRKR